jgi:D-glycero-alpha-D-manno-heptose-7-phosphate kinase
MKNYVVRSPTRVDLAGGTLDLWPLFNFVNGATTVNVAISIYTEAVITPLTGSRIELKSADMDLEKAYSSLSECLSDKDSKLALLQAQIRFWKPQSGFRLETRSESPIGGGLGGSSSLTISILKCFEQWLGPTFKSVHDLVNVAHNIEAEVLNTPTGTQDYYPAASGGINILNYSSTGIEQKVLSLENSDLEKNFLLIYTGKAHHSGLNNFEVLTRAVQKDKETMAALKDLKKVAESTAQVMQDGSKSQSEQLPDLFRQEFSSRVRLAKAFTSPEIEKLAEVSLRNGAKAVKICGAGGGGCVLVWVDPKHRQKVSEECQKAGFQILTAKPVAPLNQKKA